MQGDPPATLLRDTSRRLRRIKEGAVLKKLDAALFTCLCWAIGILLFGMMTIISVQVIARYVFNYSLSWSEEIGRYCFVWISFLGFAAAFKSGAHIALDVLLKMLRGVPYMTLKLINGFLTVALSLTILISGIKLVQLGVRQKSPALDMPMHLVYLVVPACGLFLLYFSLRALCSSNQEIKREEA